MVMEIFFPKPAVSSKWELQVYYLKWWCMCPVTPWTQSLQIPISRCLCKRQEQKLLTHWSFCPQDQPFLLQSWCPHYQDSDTKVPCFIPNKPTDHWLVYFLIWSESPIFIRSTCNLPGEIIFNIRKRTFGGFILAAWNQQVIFVFSQFLYFLVLVFPFFHVVVSFSVGSAWACASCNAASSCCRLFKIGAIYGSSK